MNKIKNQPSGTPEELDKIVEWIWNNKQIPMLDGRSDRVSFNKTDTRQYILNFSFVLIRELQLQNKSPTIRDRREKLDAIRQTAQKLTQLLYDEGTEAGLLRLAALGSGFSERFIDDVDKGAPSIAMAFRGSAIDAPSIEAPTHSDRHELVRSRLVLHRPLLALIEAVDHAKEQINSAKQGGGRERLAVRLRGDPRRNLGKNCAWLACHCRGDSVLKNRDREANPIVLDLAMRIWAFATGNEAPENYLDRMVRDGISDVRKSGWHPDTSVLTGSSIEPKNVD